MSWRIWRIMSSLLFLLVIREAIVAERSQPEQGFEYQFQNLVASHHVCGGMIGSQHRERRIIKKTLIITEKID